LPIKMLVHSILCEAIRQKASDIHFIPLKEGGIVQFRVDERLLEFKTLTQEEYLRIISHFKYSAKMDIGDQRKPQSGAMDAIIDNTSIHFRISALPSAYNESLVIRIHPQQETLSLSELSLFPSTLQQLLFLIKRSSGLILFTGPTGSGKTTILYTLLQYIQQQYKRQVVTLEDPVERKMDAFLQMEINEKAGVTYGEGFKSLLRHDPDVIMIGEIRDDDTARLVVKASLTGHLVLSTMHAADCYGCIERLKEFGICPSDLKQTLMGIVSQRLISVVCPFCGNKCENFCFKAREYRRAGIYEILSGLELEEALEKGNKEKHNFSCSFKSLSYYFNQAYAAGFITEQSYERWMGGQHAEPIPNMEARLSGSLSL
jgi:competence protein ComGA